MSDPAAVAFVLRRVRGIVEDQPPAVWADPDVRVAGQCLAAALEERMPGPEALVQAMETGPC